MVNVIIPAAPAPGARVASHPGGRIGWLEPVCASTAQSAEWTSRAGAAGSLLLPAEAGPALTVIEDDAPLGAADRRSRISKGTFCAHADLHNHTLLSDGDGDPADAYGSLRAAGLDVAALTDHAVLAHGALGDSDPCAVLPGGAAYSGCTSVRGLDGEAWRRTAAYADAADTPGAFAAIRGFEWTEPYLGHVNVWLSAHYTDVVALGDMAPLFAWLTRDPTNALGGGADGLAGFNHPGRERGCFEEFRYFPAAHDRVVSLEIFNRREDYLFEGHADGRQSPLVQCLAAGWRPGLSGVSDEHGADWGFVEGKGRTGLWMQELSRCGVMEALRARRFFATRESGLRLDATLDGTRMGGAVRMATGSVAVAVDVDRGPAWHGMPVEVQVLRPGPVVPRVVHVQPTRLGEVCRFRIGLDSREGGWVVLRVADPSRPNEQPGPAGHPANVRALGYTSPWWLEAAP